ncbi:hypothetical protein ACFL2V_02360 [Pseudomonadota bacterium]
MFKKSFVLILTSIAALMLSQVSHAGVTNLPPGTITYIQAQNSDNVVQVKLSSANYVIYLQKGFNPNYKEVYSFLLACWTAGKTVQLRVDDTASTAGPTIIAAASPAYF